eukprot:6855758-Pyramimonas_sp.AAC.1
MGHLDLAIGTAPGPSGPSPSASTLLSSTRWARAIGQTRLRARVRPWKSTTTSSELIRTQSN